MDRSCPVIHVVAGILWCEDRYLATCRPPGGPHQGLWEFPGGKVEAGESHEAALKRELREELGVEVTRCHLWRETEHVYAEPSRRVRLFFFHVPAFLGEPRALEGQGLRWLLPQEGPQLPFLEADKDLVRQIAEGDFRPVPTGRL